MRKLSLLSVAASIAGAALFATVSSPASAETYQEYLQRLRDVCSVDCLQPRELQIAARKRNDDEQTDMALIMDVQTVRQNGGKYELLSMNFENSTLLELALLGSAGIDTAGRGLGSRRGGTHPDLVIIALDEQTFHDVLNVATPLVEGTVKQRDASAEEDGIVVDGQRARERIEVEPSLRNLRTYFRNRRVVVRGQPKLEPVLIGSRRDFRRKQVTLTVNDADNIVLLPRFDESGEAIIRNR